MALTTAFCVNGNKATIPQTTTDGTVSYDQGFGSLYALPPEEGGKFIDRAQFNQLMYDISSQVIANTTAIATKANASTTVNTTSNQTINGVKTFSAPPVSATNPANNNQVANKAYVDTVGNTAVKLTGAQTINGVKTFSAPPISATNPTNANQVANKAYVDSVGNAKVATTTYLADKATFATIVTKTLTIGANEELKNLNDFRLFAIRNFANYYILSLTSDIEETEALNFNGISFSFNSSNYTITFKQKVYFSHGNFYFGNIGLKIDTQQDASIAFNNCSLTINGNLNFTDTFNSDISLSTGNLGAIALTNTNAYFGDGDTWNITTAKRHFIGILGSRIEVGNVTFNGSIPSDKELFYFARQGILMTQNSTFNNFTISGIAQNAVSSKGIWVKD